MSKETWQISFEEYAASIPTQARGQTCADEDMPRLNAQGLRVYTQLRLLRPLTLAQISSATGDPEASVSARIREIRKYLEEGNKGTIKRERVEGGNGLHTYCMRLNRYFGAA